MRLSKEPRTPRSKEEPPGHQSKLTAAGPEQLPATQQAEAEWTEVRQRLNTHSNKALKTRMEQQ